MNLYTRKTTMSTKTKKKVVTDSVEENTVKRRVKKTTESVSTEAVIPELQLNKAHRFPKKYKPVEVRIIEEDPNAMLHIWKRYARK